MQNELQIKKAQNAQQLAKAMYFLGGYAKAFNDAKMAVAVGKKLLSVIYHQQLADLSRTFGVVEIRELIVELVAKFKTAQ